MGIVYDSKKLLAEEGIAGYVVVRKKSGGCVVLRTGVGLYPPNPKNSPPNKIEGLFDDLSDALEAIRQEAESEAYQKWLVTPAGERELKVALSLVKTREAEPMVLIR